MGANVPITSTVGYSAQRLQLGSLAYSQSGSSIFSLSYGYLQNGGNNGQITAINDLVKTGRNATYTYDALSRLAAFSTSGSFTENGQNYGAESMSWTYDRYGNRLTQVRNGSTQNASPDPATNRLSGRNYDLSGNMTNDPPYTITWDAEGRMGGYSSSVSYNYDGNSLRVSKTNTVPTTVTTVFIRAGAQTLAEYSGGAAPTAPTREFIYSGSQLLATKASGNYKWYVRDHLSPRLVYDDAAATLLSYAHLPFGESWYGDANEKWRFTTYERESDVGQDYAVNRQYQFSWGHFNSPDRIFGNPQVPQSLNRYTYVLNSPLTLVDPSGLNAAAIDPRMSWLWDRFEGGGTTWDGDITGGGGGGFNSGFADTMAVAFPRYLQAMYANLVGWTEVTCRDGSVQNVVGQLSAQQAAGLGVCKGHTELQTAISSATQAFIPFAMFFADRQKSVLQGDHLFGTNYCGQGGDGPTFNDLDRSCKRHDDCYDAARVSYSDNWDPFLGYAKSRDIQQCNQLLCDDVRNLPDRGSTRVRIFFENFGLYGCNSVRRHP